MNTRALAPEATVPKRRSGRPPKPIALHPEPLWEVKIHPVSFHKALVLQMRRHGDTTYRLHRAVIARGGTSDCGFCPHGAGA